LTDIGCLFTLADVARPKNPARTVDASAYVRMTREERATIERAVAKQLEGVTGATGSVPKFLLASALKEAKRILGEK
jgi:hypothetical protein